MANISVNNEANGDIRISDEVVATIAAVATREIEGISGLNLSIAEELASKFGKKNSNKSIKVYNDEECISMDISVVVKYGIRIPDISWEVQENVKKSVESMTGLNVSKVNIIVSDVDFSSDEEKSVDEES